jgi:hypothetical protein
LLYKFSVCKHGTIDTAAIDGFEIAGFKTGAVYPKLRHSNFFKSPCAMPFTFAFHFLKNPCH